MKKNKVRDAFLEQLRKIPIIQVCCEKVGISRNSVYRWRGEDKEFQEQMDAALVEGETLVNEMSESQVLSLIREKNWQAISFWLKHRNPKFRDRVEVTAKVETSHVLTSEQEALIEEALKRAALPLIEPLEIKQNDHGKPKQ
ncbi:MAG: phBC6A51 family helix-turn-helix protein [Patescibacteria group bacterium]